MKKTSTKEKVKTQVKTQAKTQVMAQGQLMPGPVAPSVAPSVAPTTEPSRWALSQRASLMSLTKTTMLSTSFPTRAVQLARRIHDMLDGNEQVFHPEQDVVGELIQRDLMGPSAISLAEIARLAYDLHLSAIKDVDLQALGVAAAEAAPAKSLGHSRSDLRQMVRVLGEIAGALEKQTNAALRAKAKTEWLAREVLASTMPEAEKRLIKGCTFCHRHAVSSGSCYLHKLPARPSHLNRRRRDFEQELQLRVAATHQYLQTNPGELRALSQPANDAQALEAISRLGKTLFTPHTNEQFASLMQSSSGQNKSLQAIYEEWHKLVDDEAGLQIQGIRRISTAGALLHSMVRADANHRVVHREAELSADKAQGTKKAGASKVSAKKASKRAAKGSAKTVSKSRFTKSIRPTGASGADQHEPGIAGAHTTAKAQKTPRPPTDPKAPKANKPRLRTASSTAINDGETSAPTKPAQPKAAKAVKAAAVANTRTKIVSRPKAPVTKTIAVKAKTATRLQAPRQALRSDSTSSKAPATSPSATGVTGVTGVKVGNLSRPSQVARAVIASKASTPKIVSRPKAANKTPSAKR